jgi:hypothetical protein
MFGGGFPVQTSPDLTESEKKFCSFAVLQFCSFAVLQFCGLAVLQSCSLAVMLT